MRTFNEHWPEHIVVPKQHWGGDWTEVKLAALREYLKMYATALKNQSFGRIYIDAFAGTGYRSQPTKLDEGTSLFEEFKETDQFAKGSARIALEIDPPFTRYVFIEKDPRKFAELKRMIETDFPSKIAEIDFRNDDANVAIPELCRSTEHWRRNRAVLFLDPYGMQVDWTTLAAVAQTRAIDTWYLFPAFIGLGRMLPHSGVVPHEWEDTLDRCLGEAGWRNEFYQTSTTADLFDAPQDSRERRLDREKVERYFRRRLASVFAGVAPRALPLLNSRGVLMYQLFFACNGSQKARTLALKLARQVLKE